MPLVGARAGRPHRRDGAGAGLDEVQQRPGDAVAVVRAEAAGQCLRLLGRDGRGDGFELPDAPVDLVLVGILVGQGPPATKAWISGLMTPS